MSTKRPFVVSIAGFDPSAGAGVLADVKTFEQNGVYGFAITTANTIQTENQFFEMDWIDLKFVLKSVAVLFDNYSIQAVKIGIVPSLEYLKEIILAIKKYSPTTKIIWDTVLKSSTDFDFLKIENQAILIEIIKKMDLITPNYKEILQLSNKVKDGETIAKHLSEYCPVLLKGGHNPEKIGFDTLYLKNEVISIPPNNTAPFFEKHGSGCALSAAITAHLALGKDVKTACIQAKKYIENYLQSTETKLGYHYEN